MDIEKVKKNYKWDPMRGDYSKSYVSYERRLQKKKQTRNLLLTILYVLILIASIYLIYKSVK
ncbi:MAG TPA: hypothetical protein PKC91_03090 [Ignavibacteria bacterium]|nr:hypothetical protein [Ignavibacteria bacterium]